MKTILSLVCLASLICAPLALAQDERPDKPVTGQTTSQGPATDASNNPVIDPTKNVLREVDLAVKRLDDLRRAEKELVTESLTHAKEIGALRADHATVLRLADAERQEAIRQVDREDVNKTSLAAQTAITALAKQTTDISTTLAKAVTDTASAVESRQASFADVITKRISALELAQSEGRGKQAVSDPQVTAMLDEVRKMRSEQAIGAGKTEGVTSTWVAIGATITAIGAILTCFYLISNSRKTVLTTIKHPEPT